MHITVFLGAKFGKHPVYQDKIKELADWIGRSGHTLVYGGSKEGLMGILADTALKAGGKVIGIEPQFFIESAVQHEGLTQLIVTKDMAERKKKLIAHGDAFIVFPGGFGTMEEFADVLSMIALKHLNAPCIFYNLNGYYDLIRQYLDHMIDVGFAVEDQRKGVYFVDSLKEIQELLTKA
ncbi:MAG TPA: TIGR00730 family Rossman fold protein [Sutterella sp.]|nr:TIGR00730 family Rossman fold protein [Sutterella sp.]